MNQTLITLPTFYVIGISVRTTNQNAQARQDIGLLWKMFMSKPIGASIHNKLSDDIYCLYTDYESDYMGRYTTILGYQVSDLENIPDGLVGKKVETNEYQVFTSKGKLPDALGETWMNIWKSPINRKYATDFDVYGAKAQNPADAEVETFVSINN
jgi:predicted transcriptional regulator YdeE